MKSLYLLLPLLILCLVLVSAVPGKFTSEALATGYVCEFPDTTPIKVNTSFEFNFHCFNLTNGVAVLNRTFVGCTFHLYNNKGEHLYKNKDVHFGDQFDWEVPVSGPNFSYAGNYAFVFQCNQSVLGGYLEQNFLVTKTGLEESSMSNNSLNTSIYFFLGIALLFFLAFIFLPISLPLKITFGVLSFIFIVIAMDSLSIIVANQTSIPALISLYDFISAIFFYLLWFALALLFITWIITFIITMTDKNTLKKQQNYGSQLYGE